MELIFPLVLILYLVTPLTAAGWMASAWRRNRRKALVVGGIILAAWLVSMTALVMFFLSGHWYSETATPEQNQRDLIWMTTASAIIVMVNFGLIRGISRRWNQGTQKQ